jgi:hypothetical protein
VSGSIVTFPPREQGLRLGVFDCISTAFVVCVVLGTTGWVETLASLPFGKSRPLVASLGKLSDRSKYDYVNLRPLWRRAGKAI